MSKGKAKVNLIGSAGDVTHSVGPDWSFIYSTSLVKDAHWSIGDRVVLPDGREFRYAKSSAACISGQGCEFIAVGVNSYQAALVAQAVGDKQVTLPACTHDAFAKDELRGGYVLVYDGSTNNVQFRGIIGNAATAADLAFVIYLDGPLTEAVVASTSAIEAFQNPYSGLRTGTSASLAKAGTPAVKVTAALTYFWVQVKGFTWVAPQGTVDGNQIGCYWRHDGSLQDAEVALGALTMNANVSSQLAGYTVEGNHDGIGPLFMLQG